MGWLDPVKDGKHLVRAESSLTSFLKEHRKDRNAQPVREGALLRRSSSQTVLIKMWLLPRRSKRPCVLLRPFVCFCNFAGGYHWFDLATL